MHRRTDSRRNKLELQGLYSVAALARMGNVTVQLMLRVLRSNGVAFVQAGRSVLVPLTEVQRKIPPLWESLMLVERARVEAGEEGRREGRSSATSSGRRLPR
jgi:hypothetical protein